jgi:hypothetical protein
MITATIWLMWFALHMGTGPTSPKLSEVQLAFATLGKMGCYLAVAILLTVYVNR